MASDTGTSLMKFIGATVTPSV